MRMTTTNLSRNSVHLHACGDNDMLRKDENLCARFTSTRVETMTNNLGGIQQKTVHLHACGDNVAAHGR